MTATSADVLSVVSPWDVPQPVLLNVWKHHAGAIRQRIQQAIQGGDAALGEMADQLLVMGTELMDLYIGKLTPAAGGFRQRIAVAVDVFPERNQSKASPVALSTEPGRSFT